MSLPFKTSPAENLAYRRMEEGVHRPLLPRPSQQATTTREFCKLFMGYFTVGLGIVLLACLFVYRYAFHIPDFEDNFGMIVYLSSVLTVIGLGFLVIHAKDLET